MRERSRERLRLGVHAMPNRATLHHDDGVMTVLALRRGGQPDDVARLHLPQHLLEAHRREVVTFIDDDVAVVGHEVVHDLLAVQTLDDVDIDDPGATSASTTDLVNTLDGQIQKCSEPFAPLIQKLAAMRARVNCACTQRQPSTAKIFHA